MLRIECIRDAVECITTAALLGRGWEEALHRFAYASGAHGAVLMRNRPDRVLAFMFSEDVAETVSAYAAGRAPPNSRYRRVRLGPRLGFRVDHDDYRQDQLDRDPYYQEFLRPAGFFWHANAALTFGRDEYVELSLKRRVEAGPYQREDALTLDAVLPQLRAAARLATRALDSDATAVSTLLRDRGDPLYQLDAMGRVLSTETLKVFDRAEHPISVIGRKLRARDGSIQPALDHAVAMAVARPGAVGLSPLTAGSKCRHFIQVVPVPGLARDIFLSAAATAVLIDVRSPLPYRRLAASTIGHALALTDREADVACLLAEGLSPAAIAERLRMQPATARVHLRSIFEKTGTKRQAELVAFLGYLRP
jgi:DNA-binding CsgD family transcriptional regulator